MPRLPSQRPYAFPAARLCLALGWFAAVTVVLIGAAALVGYAFRADWLWQPHRGTGTHPVVAFMLLLFGGALATARTRRLGGGALSLVGLIAIVALLRLPDLAFGLGLLDRVVPPRTPSSGAVSVAAFGWDEAIMLVFLSLSAGLRRAGTPFAAQSAAAMGLALASMSLLGYLYGLSGHHGEMPLTTTLGGLLLAMSLLLTGARTGFMRGLVLAGAAGRFVRLQFLVVALVAVAGGFVVKHLGLSTLDRAFPMYVVAVTGMSSIAIALGAVAYGRSDRRRRVMERKVADLAVRDALTGLFNRHFLEEHSESMTAHARRHGYAMALLLIDIDSFKPVNDTYGHVKGDEILVAISAVVMARIRRSDVAVRYGGEELAVILLNASEDHAMRVAEDIRNSVAALDVSSITPGLSRITVSVGVAPIGEDFRAAIEAADAALYAAKDAGRNRVEGYRDGIGRLPEAAPMLS